MAVRLFGASYFNEGAERTRDDLDAALKEII